MFNFKPLPPVQRVMELLDYDSENGILIWKQSVTRWIKPGRPAGTKIKHSITVTVDKKRYAAHRIIWLIVTGEDPAPFLIDHIDGNPFNNKFENLRLATQQQNQCNQKIRSDNTSGLKGVSWDKDRNKWQSGIYVNKKRVALGRFNTKEEAYEAYCKAAKESYGDFARFK